MSFCFLPAGRPCTAMCRAWDSENGCCVLLDLASTLARFLRRPQKREFRHAEPPTIGR